MKKSTKIIACLLVLVLALGIVYCTVSSKSIYADADNWAYLELAADGKAADTFFICPTVYGGAGGEMNWTTRDEATAAAFVGATNMEKGIYDENTRFFAPFYRQTSLYGYEQSPDVLRKSLDSSYADVKDAFEYYLRHCNNGRPIVLAGFSQGADMCIRLLKDYFSDAKLSKQLVACYAIGWYITEEEMAANPQIHFAQAADDVGVLIAFGTEAPDAEPCVVHPADVKSLCINPLSWTTDTAPADKALNKGACFTDYSGSVTREVPELTGAYIEPERGVLIATDVTPDEYPAFLSFAGPGIYHIYDYQFFYRNLQENVNLRIESYLAA